MGTDYISNIEITGSNKMPTIRELLEFITKRECPGIKAFNYVGHNSGQGEFYCAYPIIKTHPEYTGETHTLYIGVVILVDLTQRDSVGFKLMSEDMGPYYYKADKHVIDSLSPIDELFLDENTYCIEQAQKWREQCLIVDSQ